MTKPALVVDAAVEASTPSAPDRSSSAPALSPDSLLQRAVAAATRAPSVHNTQPWSFRILAPTADGSGAGSIEVYADRARQLAVLDPTGRQLRVSCGAAIFFAEVQLRAEGHDATVAMLPDDDPAHLASIDVTVGEPAGPLDAALAAAIEVRHTQRSPFEARAVPEALLTGLRDAVEAEGAWLDVLYRRDDQIALSTLLARADREELRDPAYREELALWLRSDPSPDGVPVAALPSNDERHSEVVIRNFDLPASPEAPSEATERPLDEHPALVVLGTEGDGPRDHLVAGRALGRLLLLAAAGGVTASPLGQVVDLPGPRARLGRELNLVGKAQMVLRLGYAAPRDEEGTGRRPVAEVLLPVEVLLP